jgi:hypothetical protein
LRYMVSYHFTHCERNNLTDFAAFSPADQPLRAVACFGKAMVPELCVRRGQLGGW